MAPPVFFHAQTDEEAKLLVSQIPTIVTLTKGCKSAQVVRDLSQIPPGCGGSIVTATVAVHTLVRVRRITHERHFANIQPVQ